MQPVGVVDRVQAARAAFGWLIRTSSALSGTSFTYATRARGQIIAPAASPGAVRSRSCASTRSCPVRSAIRQKSSLMCPCSSLLASNRASLVKVSSPDRRTSTITCSPACTAYRPTETACHPDTPSGQVTAGAAVSGSARSITPVSVSVSYGSMRHRPAVARSLSALCGVQRLRSVT